MASERGEGNGGGDWKKKKKNLSIILKGLRGAITLGGTSE